MSRIGKKPVSLPSGVKAALAGSVLTIEGKNGKLSYSIDPRVKVEIKEGAILVVRPSDEKQDKATHGLIRSIINNMIKGVSEGYRKDLEITGVGFKAQVQGKVLLFRLTKLWRKQETANKSLICRKELSPLFALLQLEIVLL